MGWPNPMCFRSMASSPEHVGQRRGETKKSRPRSYSLGLNLAIIRRGFIERETALETRTDLQKPPSHCRLGSNTAAPFSASMLTVRSAVDVGGRFYSSWQALLPQTFKSSHAGAPEERLANDPKIFQSSQRMSSVACRIRLINWAYSGLYNCSRHYPIHPLISLNSAFHPAARQVASPVDTSPDGVGNIHLENSNAMFG